MLSIRKFVFVCLVFALLLPPIPSAIAKERGDPSWPNRCGDGRVDLMLENFETLEGITPFKGDPTIPDPLLRLVEGCNGQAVAIDYDLDITLPDDKRWVVLQWPLTTNDLSGYTHLRLALRGSDLDSRDNLEIKLKTPDGLYAVTLQSMTDLPVWRPIYIDLRQLTGSGDLDLANVTHFELAIVHCAGDCEVSNIPGQPLPPNKHAATVFVDELALVDLRPDGQHRLLQEEFEQVALNWDFAAKAAEALLNKVVQTGPAKDLVPAWFEEAFPNYNIYTLAETLLVFLYEYQRTGDIRYRDAANKLATQLLNLQIADGNRHAGAWYSSYNQELGPPFRALPENGDTEPGVCNGNETLVNNIDACMWVGNVGWVLLALSHLYHKGIYSDPTALTTAIDRDTTWLIGQMGREESYPDLISLGVEGNISAYFGLRAAGKDDEAQRLGKALFQHGWDPVQQRMKIGVQSADYATAMDVAGSWGVSFLRSMAKEEEGEALASAGYAATVLRTSSFSETVYGYGDIAGPVTVAVEFGAQAAVAGIKDAEFVMQQLYPLQAIGGDHEGAFPGAPDHWYGGSPPPWNTTMHGVSPTAWVYFAATNQNPLGPLPNTCTRYIPIIHNNR